MTPYYEDESTKIYNEDALEIIDKLEPFDYLITDPPYSVSWNTLVTGKSSVKGAIEMAQGMQLSFLAAMFRAIKKNKNFAAWVFCDWKMASFLPPIFKSMDLSAHSCIVWDKITPSFSRHYHHTHEFVVCASNFQLPKGIYLGKDIVRQKKITSKNKQHPFDKPPELIETICGKFPPGRVVDPFCGAGGLLVGAQRLGWEVVGIDISTEFCETASSRLSSSQLLLSETQRW